MLNNQEAAKERTIIEKALEDHKKVEKFSNRRRICSWSIGNSRIRKRLLNWLLEDGEEFSEPELVHCHMNPKEITEIKEDTNEEIKDDKTVEKRTEIRPTAVVAPECSSHLSNQLPLSITRQIAVLRLFPYWALIIVNEPPGHFLKFKTSPHMTASILYP